MLTALSNAALGGAAFAIGHDFWSTLLLGVFVYLATLCVRWLWWGGARMPSFQMAMLGLVLGVAISSAVDTARTYDHRQQLLDWYAELSRFDKEKVRENVHQWLEQQSPVQRESLLVMAQLTGYENPEDYIVFNNCSPSNKELAAIWKRFGASLGRQP